MVHFALKVQLDHLECQKIVILELAAEGWDFVAHLVFKAQPDHLEGQKIWMLEQMAAER